jgi:hypothetical protein
MRCSSSTGTLLGGCEKADEVGSDYESTAAGVPHAKAAASRRAKPGVGDAKAIAKSWQGVDGRGVDHALGGWQSERHHSDASLGCVGVGVLIDDLSDPRRDISRELLKAISIKPRHRLRRGTPLIKQLFESVLIDRARLIQRQAAVLL